MNSDDKIVIMRFYNKKANIFCQRFDKLETLKINMLIVSKKRLYWSVGMKSYLLKFIKSNPVIVIHIHLPNTIFFLLTKRFSYKS